MGRALGVICGSSGGAERAGAAYDAGEVAEAGDDEAIGKLEGASAVGEGRTQWRIAPSPSESRTGCTGCRARAVRQSVNDVSSIGP